MIKRLETAEEIAKLLIVEDDVEQYLPCTHGEWIQWLVSQAENSRMGIWAHFNDAGRIDSYIVVFNNVNPPLSRHSFIPYVWSNLAVTENEATLREIKEWSKSIGAISIKAIVDELEPFEKYGFKEVGRVIELKL